MPEEINNHGKKPIAFNRIKEKSPSISEPSISFNIINISRININISTSKVVIVKSLDKKDKMTFSQNIQNYLKDSILNLKNFRWKYFFIEVFMRNIYVFLFLVLLIQTQILIRQYYFCDLDNSNILAVGYFIFKDVFFFLYYYILFGSYSFFPIFDIPMTLNRIIVANTIFWLLLKVYGIDPFTENYVNIHGTNILWTMVCIFIHYKNIYCIFYISR